MPQSRRPPPSTASSKGKHSKKSEGSKQRHINPNINPSTGQAQYNSNANNTKTSKQDGTNATNKNIRRKQTDPRVLSQFKAILNTFQHTFSHLFTPQLPELIQSVKQSLYLRDYVAAFDSPEKLQAYAVRWSVARALAYFEMIAGLDIGVDYDNNRTLSPSSNSWWWSEDVTRNFSRRQDKLSVTCIGGGAGAEIVGMAAAYSFLNPPTATTTSTTTEDKLEEGDDKETEATNEIGAAIPASGGLDLTFLDFATWAPITDSLYATITSSDSTAQGSISPKISLNNAEFSARCYQQDVLTPLSDTTTSSMASADVVTILFTAGELYSQSPTATTKFLMSLHALTKPGALLVIVDSAGGFEDLDVLSKKNKPETGSSSAGTQSNSANIGGYKLGFLLDKTLTNHEQWQTIASQDAKWWRVPQELKDSSGYPLELENMRCLIRVYRRNDDH
ncbi:hypothetical protein TWF730_004327 [Orbilia blumenaviensis]|uniref:25S rRNA (Uridine(2843)-N(3))-methyltransferase n=1 Tax=Orbilia blumenaviensis TaxID=1796055 RepID=A0AAV9U094_9PEZI